MDWTQAAYAFPSEGESSTSMLTLGQVPHVRYVGTSYGGIKGQQRALSVLHDTHSGLFELELFAFDDGQPRLIGYGAVTASAFEQTDRGTVTYTATEPAPGQATGPLIKMRVRLSQSEAAPGVRWLTEDITSADLGEPGPAAVRLDP